MKNKVISLLVNNKKNIIIYTITLQLTLVLFISAMYIVNEWDLIGDEYINITWTANFVFGTLLISGVIGVLSLFWLENIFNIIDEENRYKIQQEKLKQMEAHNDILRGQKHDFMNNLQVIWGLVAMNDRERTIDYINELTQAFKYDETESIDVCEDCQYLNTLLQNKAYQCKELDITLELNLYDIEALAFVNPIDKVNIFGNLIDNAIYEVKKLERSERKIAIDVYKEKSEVLIDIFNVGPKIDDQIKHNLFDKGFTTKGDKGSGFGLFNVKKIVDKYNGAIEVLTDQYGTSFFIKLHN
ncbi:GHKL domain-containing protein [Serpentinicella sp. ANB-PHB4]|uniref:sensor histidine kinase n=1 Tax=Serpentinicella sp. ANB-PHB4 TaxID=3074076 RepID=UPI0028678121|nr:GHKL domain-containing protein [Serpentinicella sp. ANB-PHB4]MDR5659171.1 GHKL domain-containing protein [Serpentinicella sp. ANB-PHB4]